MRSPHDGKSSSTVPMGTGGRAGTGGGDGGVGAGGYGGTSGKGGSSGTSGTGGTSGAGTGGTGGDVACVPGVPTTSQIPRLSGAEYDRTIRDLLGVTGLTAASNAAPSSLLAPDQPGSVSTIAWSAYQSVGELIAQQVIADAGLKAKFMTCTPVPDDATCFHDTIVAFGRRAFRRPLATEEVADFDALVAKGPDITEHGTEDEIAETLLFAFLVSPSFLQRAETAETPEEMGHFVLSSYEVAQRLSFMLWGSTPDPELDDAANADRLSTAEQIAIQADRMLADPKARDMVAAFHRYYLRMGDNTRWTLSDHDPLLFPGFTRDLLPVMQAETEKLFDDVVFGSKGTFQDLLLTNKAFVTAGTASFYGLDPSRFGAELTETTLEQRPGFLTRLGFLNAYSSYSRSSPILRGAFIAKEVLGLNIGAPPPGAPETPIPNDPTLDTNRKLWDAVTAGAACRACHQELINPPGYVLEAYDAVGRFQTVEAATQVPIDTAADVVVSDLGDVEHVANPAELMEVLASSSGAQHRYATKWVSFAYQREDVPADQCIIDEVAQKMASDGYTVLNLVADLTQADSFRLRAVAQP